MSHEHGGTLKVRFWWGSVEFDGRVLRVTRPWRVRWRPRTTRIPVADLGYAEFHEVGESGRGWWTITRRGGAEEQMYLSVRSGRRLSGVNHAVLRTVVGRTTMLLAGTDIGLGPWPDEVWQRVLALSPGMAALRGPDRATLFIPTPGVPTPSEADIALAGLRDPSLQPTFPKHTWWESVRRINDAEPWRVLLAALSADREPTTDPEWSYVAAAAIADGRTRSEPDGRPGTAPTTDRSRRDH